MNIAFVSSEVVPFAKTGGLADVCGALPKELDKKGLNVRVFMPKYYSIDEQEYNLTYVNFESDFRVRVAGYAQPINVFKGYLPNSLVEIYFIDAPQFFHRSSLYTNDWDENERFILFQKAVIETIQRLNWKPDVIHCNDWQTGLIPLLIKDNYNWDKLFEDTAFLYTIHNIGYQGVFGSDTIGKAEVKPELFHNGHLEHNGAFNFMKAGILYSDIISTVSETYASEILTPEYGAGMNQYLAERQDDLYGILNGIDYNIWNPETDKLLMHHYSSDDFTGKEINKRMLLKRMGLDYRPEVPVIGIVSRLAPQKGFDLISHVIDELMSYNAQWVILGSGEFKYEVMFNELINRYHGKVGVYIGFNNELSHLVEAGADIFLMPSHYEPCGLNQMYSLKYGTVPVVRKTGGLADTVFDWYERVHQGHHDGNGFSFEDYAGWGLVDAVKRAITEYHNKPVWHKIMKNGMQGNYSWSVSADKYIKLYEKARDKKELEF